ncbi:DUF4197 domain-containing protein [Pseudoduganella sp. LjRoot289]|uniref:DUF4197 domain-containing protein n=1 Tax=Pseudoduganella sp. LjRoot289 TaxID=3342314 RepID=UPI003ECD2C2E
MADYQRLREAAVFKLNRLPLRPLLPALLSTLLLASSAWAVSLADLSRQDMNGALKAALERGSSAAVGKLGVENGFLSNDKVKIQLPRILEQARPILQMTGQAQRLDELVVSMNHAAEAAVPLAKPLLMDAVRNMTLTDAKNILTGGDTSVTQFFREKTSAQLGVKFLPIVKKVTDRSDLSAKYNGAMAKVSKMGLAQTGTVEDYVTQRALDGLYIMIAEEEKAIRDDPIGTGSKLIGKVFGALK